MNLKDVLKRLRACNEAQARVGDQTAEQAYRTCERGDWMLWLAARLGVDNKLVVLDACECAEQALVYVPDGETRPAMAIETARAWCRGEATLVDVQNAASDAAAAWAGAASLKQSADIVRKHIPLGVFLDKLNGVC